MSREIKISAIILSAILISSCATDRISYVRKGEIDCITPKARFHPEKNIPIHAIKSNNRYYARSRNQTAWNKKQNIHSAKNIIKNDKYPEVLVYDLKENTNSQILTHSGLKEVISFQQIPKISEISLYFSDLKHIPVQLQLINRTEDGTKYPSQENINVPSYSNDLLNQDDMNAIFLAEGTTATRELIPDPLKQGRFQETPFHKSEIFILMMALLGGLIPLAAIKIKPKLASDISFWAAMNPWKTRFMFAGVQIAFGIAGVILGERLAANGIHFSDLSRDLLVGAFLTSSMLYPVKYSTIKLFKHSYLKQKAFDLALAISGFMLMVNAGNEPGLRASLTNMVNFKGHEQQNVKMLNDQSQASKQLLYYQNDKQFQDEQTASKYKEPSRGLKIFYTVLAVLATLALAYLVALAACGLSCNGMVGFAAVTGIGGAGLVIAFAIWAIKSIWHPKPKKRIKPSESTVSI
jgi:hypothetical protein